MLQNDIAQLAMLLFYIAYFNFQILWEVWKTNIFRLNNMIITNKGKGKWKLLPGIEEITKGTGTHKHTETVSRYIDWHGRLSQSKESKCLWTHDKDGITREFTCVCVCLSLLWSLQFLVRVFTFLSLNLWFSCSWFEQEQGKV